MGGVAQEQVWVGVRGPGQGAWVGGSGRRVGEQKAVLP